MHDKVRQEIQAQTKITQGFAKQASTAIASYSDQQKQTLQDQIKKASDADTILDSGAIASMNLKIKQSRKTNEPDHSQQP